jgi:hypothetical protein
VVVTVNPVVAAVGAGEPQGSAMTFQVVAVLGFVHAKVALFEVTADAAKVLGFGQVGGGAQTTLANHPTSFTEPSLRKRNVKHPLTSVEVNEGKLAPVKVPQNEPGTPPGTLPAPLALAICGEFMVGPLNTYNPSQLASVSNKVKVTVTTSPAFTGQIVTVESVLLA